MAAIPAVLLVACVGLWFALGHPDRSAEAANGERIAVAAQEAARVEATRSVRPAAPLPEPAAAVVPAAAAVRLPITIQTATEEQILHHVLPNPDAGMAVFRFEPNPKILVIDFGSLRAQGGMLNRAAAFEEKAGLPHDRVMTDAELNEAIHASGDTTETFYYGHDYAAPALARFFDLANRDNIPLSREEDVLHQLLGQEGWLEAGARGGLITIPRVGADAHVSFAARTTILHHELAHGEYFTNPDYQRFVHRFWTEMLTPNERDRIRRHLRAEGYDQTLDTVVENEAQAYLIFTTDPEFFKPNAIGMTKARLNEIRNAFYKAMPPGWLRDSLGQDLKISGKP